MAIFDFDVRSISRKNGRSSTAAAAYRAGVDILDERTQTLHAYARRGGVLHSEIALPAGCPAIDRSALWNAAEAAERRCDSKVGREVRMALPCELPRDEQIALARRFADELIGRYGVAVDVAVHASHRSHRTEVAPGEFIGGDARNVHAHLLLTTRAIGPSGALGAKTRVLDSPQASPPEVRWMRERWAQVANEALAAAGVAARIDHRSLRARGDDRPPQIHLGPAALEIARRGGHSRAVGAWRDRQRERDEADARLAAAAAARDQAAAARDQVEQATAALARLVAERDRDDQARAGLVVTRPAGPPLVDPAQLAPDDRREFDRLAEQVRQLAEAAGRPARPVAQLLAAFAATREREGRPLVVGPVPAQPPPASAPPESAGPPAIDLLPGAGRSRSRGPR